MAFNKPVAGDPVAESDINQIIEALDGSAAQGEPIAITRVDDIARYALDLMNLDAVNSFGLRIRKENGGLLFRVSKTGSHFGANITLEQGVTIDGLLPATHKHDGTPGNGVPIEGGGFGIGSITDVNLAAGAVVTAAIRDGAVGAPKLADGAVTAQKLWTPLVTGVAFGQHNDSPGMAHGLPEGAYVAGANVKGAYLQGVVGQSSVTEDGDSSIIVTWPTAFTTLVSASSAFGVASGARGITEVKALSLSATGATHVFAQAGTDVAVLQESWIAMGQ